MEAVAKSPETTAWQARVLDAEAERELLYKLSGHDLPWEVDGLIHRQFERAVDANPERVALYFEDQQMNYGQLDRQANRLARELVERGIGPDVRVGVYLRRSPDLVVALIAVLKAGGAYVPIDSGYPLDRAAYVLADAQVAMLVTTGDLVSRLGDHPPVLLIDEEVDALEMQADTRLELSHDSGQLAYVLYTSGSTGRPKGVMVEHRNVVSYLAAMDEAIGLDASGVWLSATTVTFDISVLEIFGSLTRGRTVVLMGEMVLGQAVDVRYTMPELVKRYGVTHFQCTPMQCRILMLEESGREAIGSLQQLIVAGEELAQDLADELTARMEGQLINGYGPTETTVFSTTAWIKRGEKVSIGRPIANTRTYIVDEHKQLVAPGSVGELYIGGPGVGRGYLGRADLTQERFVSDWLRPEQIGKLYRTGDLARYQADGTIQYLGRNDDQVKIRGYRIEIGEIESVLRKVVGVTEIAVVARGEGVGRRLVAYVVTGTGYQGDEELFAIARNSLQEYMVPATVIHLEKIPLTSTGKLDRKALPEPMTVPTTKGSEPALPSDELESMLCEMWKDLLGASQLGVTDNFFAQGGHSLLAVRLFNEIHSKFGIRLPLSTMISCPTVRQLAVHLRTRLTSNEGGARWSTIVPIRSQGDLPPLFCVSGMGGNPINLRHIANAMGDSQPFFALQHRGVDGILQPHRRIEAMAEEFLHDIREIQPEGPYFLAGYSSGGLAAYQMARILVEAGESVAIVVLLDTYNPLILRWPLLDRFRAHLSNIRRVGSRYVWDRGKASLMRNVDHLRRYVRGQLGHKYRFEYRIDAMETSMLEAERNYHPASLRADVLLIRADYEVPATRGIGYPRHESNGWRELVEGNLDIAQIRSEHLEIVEESMAGPVALLIRRAVATARARLDQSTPPRESLESPKVDRCTHEVTSPFSLK